MEVLQSANELMGTCEASLNEALQALNELTRKNRELLDKNEEMRTRHQLETDRMKEALQYKDHEHGLQINAKNDEISVLTQKLVRIEGSTGQLEASNQYLRNHVNQLMEVIEQQKRQITELSGKT